MRQFWMCLSACSLLSTASCEKLSFRDNTNIYPIPYGLFFRVRQGQQRLPDAVLDRLKLSYFKGGTKSYVPDFSRASDTGRALGILTTRDVALVSSTGIKEFFLEYPDGTADSLHVDYVELSFQEAKNHPCQCRFPLLALRYQGQPALLDSTLLDFQAVYRFDRD